MKTIKKLHWLFLLLFLVILSCDDETVPSITLNQTELNVSDTSSSQSISIQTNMSWTAKSSENWCEVSPKSGDESTKTITVKVATNDSYDARSCTLTIMAGELSRTVTIEQAANKGLIVNKDKYELSNDGGIIDVEVKANVEFDIEISDKWITKVETRRLTETKLQFQVAKNEDYDNRESTITIKQKDGNLSSTIKVYQSQKDAIILSDKTFDLSSESQAIQVELKTNVEFEVIIPEDSNSWVSYTPTRGLRTETLTFNIAENKDCDGRSNEVYVKNKKTNLQDTLTINQAANTGLIVSPDKYEFSNDGGTFNVEIKADVDYKVTINDNWITQIETKGLTTSNLTFEVAKNESYSNREGTITISQKNGDLSSTITVFQSQIPLTDLKDGFNILPFTPDADQELTVVFKAAKSSSLYAYTGDVYAHTGVVTEGVWMFVPAEWNQNIAKCKMTKVEDNVWSIKYTPTIRQWFKSGETAVNKIGIVIRSSDGTKKGVEDDYFINITDSKYEGFEPAAVKTAPQPGGLKHGINIIDNSTVTLVLYEKDKNGARKDFAHVVGDFNNWTLSNTEESQMYRDDAAGTWWITISGLDSSKEHAFQYYVGTKGGETIRLADPYSRKILDPYNDKYIPASTYPDDMTYPEGAIGMVSVFKTVEDTYNWRVPNFEAPDVGNMVIYELLLRDFTTSGDINGAMQKLDYLQSLGVNAIELMPIQEFDGNDSWGYNPAFFFAMDKAYGTDRMYKEFIDACHERGMAVILDVVYNHATGANPFAKLYWNSSKSETAPNNPWFNVTAPHPYSVFHDFNHESPLVREFVKRNLTFLIEEYNIDGFRFDLTKGFTQRSSNEGTASNYDASRIAILKDYNNSIKAVKPETYVILEHFCDDREETELSNEGMMMWRNMNNAYCQSAMGFSAESDFKGLYYHTSARPANSLVSYMESHDEERAAYKQTQWGKGPLESDLNAQMSQLATNAAFFFTVPGPKMIWQFGEMGYDVSIDYNGRTGKKPVKWEYLNVPERKQLHNTYTELIALRNNHPELFTPSATLRWQVSTTNWDNGRFITLTSPNNKHVVVVGNFTNEDKTLDTTFPRAGQWYNYMNRTDTTISATKANIEVPKNSFKIYTSFSNPSTR